MKSPLRLYIGILVLLAFSLSPAFGEKRSSPDMTRIQKRGRLIVAVVMGDRYPFFMRTSQGDDTGFDIDMARDIAARLGVRIEFNRNASTFDDVIDIVARKEADLGISDLTATLERAKKVSFSTPYLTLGTYILANRRQAIPFRQMSTHEIVNRRDVRIMVESGTSYMTFAKNEFPLAVVMPHRNVEQALQEVLKGKVFGLFEGEDYVKALFRKRPDLYLDLETLRIQGLEDHVAIAVPWESVHLLSWLNLYLKTDKPGITIDDILNRYPRK
jgi:polar amino acid transport system substrate-binding protein